MSKYSDCEECFVTIEEPARCPKCDMRFCKACYYKFKYRLGLSADKCPKCVIIKLPHKHKRKIIKRMNPLVHQYLASIEA